MKTILVTGGAGYIGSFMVRLLLNESYQVVVLDNLERGHKEALDSRAEFINGDIRDGRILKDLFKSKNIDAVMHFAGLISVEESTRNPELYQDNNVTGSRILFENAIENGVKRFIFSSTAAVYGNPIKVPIPENHPKKPTSPYGETKLSVEEMLSNFHSKDSSISFAALRYFNASGAAMDGTLGEDHNPETHIIPLAIKAAISGSEFKLYGTDYDTPDGTCIRDYIHVLDLVEAHLLALKRIVDVPGEYYYNVGTGVGFSNREVISTIENIGGNKIKVIESERREGDADQLIADPSRINVELGFKPKYSDLATIVESAWKWHDKNSKLKAQSPKL